MKILSIFHICLSGILLLLFLQGCAAPPTKTYVKDGIEYGKVRGAFRHRWWNYYERGLSFMEGEFYNEAISDFDQAIEQRFADQRMARTYGMHFIDYFPHREMGLVYYLLGDYDTAKKELELSQQQHPSAKAQYYLDRIRKILMERENPEISIPRIMVDLPSDEIWTKDDPFIIAGRVEDQQYVSGITLAGNSLFLEAAEQRIDFEEELELEQGQHIIDIAAENLLGGESDRRVIIHVDRQGPVITLETYPPDAPAQNSINGFLYDESGEISLSVDGVQVPVPEGEDIPFTAPVKPEAKYVTLIAKDKLGNETQAEVGIKSLMALNRYPLLASSEFGDIMSDIDGYKLALSIGKQDTRNPVIKLTGWSDEQTVFLDKAYIEGDVRDESDIVDLTINNVPVLRRKSQIIFFNHLVDLREGKNFVEVRAKDRRGNEAVKKISIVRQVPRVFQLGSRFSMTLIPFEINGLVTGLGDMYENLFLVKLMDQNRFRIIEREKLDIVLQEQKLSRSELINRQTALKLGRLVAAQTTLVGNFIETRIGIEVVARLIDNETSELLAVKDVYDEYKDRAALLSLAEGLAVKFHREFPLVDGMVVQEKGNSFFTDLGEGKTKPQRRLIVYREGEKIRHPDTGKVLGSDTEIIGYARVTQVMGDMSQAELLEDLKEKDIKIRDKVMSQ